jgi:hypothetical protein
MNFVIQNEFLCFVTSLSDGYRARDSDTIETWMARRHAFFACLICEECRGQPVGRGPYIGRADVALQHLQWIRVQGPGSGRKELVPSTAHLRLPDVMPPCYTHRALRGPIFLCASRTRVDRIARSPRRWRFACRARFAYQSGGKSALACDDFQASGLLRPERSHRHEQREAT